jgi:hypothetical protein
VDNIKGKVKFRHNLTSAMGNYQGGTGSKKLLKFVKRQAKSWISFWPVCLSVQVCRAEFGIENLWQHNLCEKLPN